MCVIPFLLIAYLMADFGLLIPVRISAHIVCFAGCSWKCLRTNCCKDSAFATRIKSALVYNGFREST